MGKRIKLEKILNVIKKGTHARRKLCNVNGEMCALGELLHAAGIEKHCLMGRGGPEQEELTVLKTEYGIEVYEAQKVMMVNDYWGTLDNRRRALEGYFAAIERGRNPGIAAQEFTVGSCESATSQPK